MKEIAGALSLAMMAVGSALAVILLLLKVWELCWRAGRWVKKQVGGFIDE